MVKIQFCEGHRNMKNKKVDNLFTLKSIKSINHVKGKTREGKSNVRVVEKHSNMMEEKKRGKHLRNNPDRAWRIMSTIPKNYRSKKKKETHSLFSVSLY